jgi:hypothetical protein
MAERKQMRYSDKELELIKSTFQNEDTLIALRKKMLDFPLSETEAVLVDFKGELLKVVSKTLNPQIDPEAPINQVVDLWMTVPFHDKTPEMAMIQFLAREKVLDYVDARLAGKKVKFSQFKFDSKKSAEDNLVNQTARNTILAHVEQQLNQFKFLAEVEDETIEQLEERLKKDSAK